MKQEPYDDDTPMPFGIHKGKRLENVPAAYLLWLYRDKEGVFSGPTVEKLRAYIKDNLDVLEKEDREQKAKSKGHI